MPLLSLPRSKSPITAAHHRKIILSYAPDWLLTITLAAIFYSLNKVEGYRREFSVSDTSLRHTYAVHERIPNVALYLIAFVAPFVIQPIVNFITIRSWWDFHNASLGLILGLAMTGSITQFVKITVGRPRPDLIDRCQPLDGTVDPTYGLSTWDICTQTDNYLLRDGFRSFPSGHSSMSFAGLGFLAFYLAGKMHLFDKRGHTGKAWLSLSPFCAAALVAISRSMDYRHHWHDILIGSILGTVMSYFSYRQYFPNLNSETSHLPYSPRIKFEDEETLPFHLRHDSSASLDRSIPRRRYTDEPSETEYEMDGTVPRPAPKPLHDVWQNGNTDSEEQPPMGRGILPSRDIVENTSA